MGAVHPKCSAENPSRALSFHYWQTETNATFLPFPPFPQAAGIALLVYFWFSDFTQCRCHEGPGGGCHFWQGAGIFTACVRWTPQILRSAGEGWEGAAGHHLLVPVSHKAAWVICSRGKPLLPCFLHSSCTLSAENGRQSRLGPPKEGRKIITSPR